MRNSSIPCQQRWTRGMAMALASTWLTLVLTPAATLAQPVVTTNSAGALVLTNHFGDLNDDSTADVRDLVVFSHHLTGTQPLSPSLTNRLDLNQEGVGNAVDQAILASMIACRYTKGDEDFDGDELSNVEELQRGTNPFRPDTDGDGWLDGWEVAEGTNPLDAQSGLKLFVVARPPIQVLSPLIQDSDTNVMGTILARPPVTVTGPPN